MNARLSILTDEPDSEEHKDQLDEPVIEGMEHASEILVQLITNAH